MAGLAVNPVNNSCLNSHLISSLKRSGFSGDGAVVWMTFRFLLFLVIEVKSIKNYKWLIMTVMFCTSSWLVAGCQLCTDVYLKAILTLKKRFYFHYTFNRNRSKWQLFNKYPLMFFQVVWYYPKVPQQLCELLTLFMRSAFFRHLNPLKLYFQTCKHGWNFIFVERVHFGCCCIVSIKQMT